MSDDVNKKPTIDQINERADEWVVRVMLPLVDATEPLLGDPENLALELNVVLVFAHRLQHLGWTKAELLSLFDEILIEDCDIKQETLQ